MTANLSLVQCAAQRSVNAARQSAHSFGTSSRRIATVVIKHRMKQPMMVAPALPEIRAAAAFPSPRRFPIRMVVASPVVPTSVSQSLFPRRI